MQRVTCSHYSPELQSAGSDLGRLLPKGGTTDSFGMELSKKKHLVTCQEEVLKALQSLLDSLEDEMTPQQYEESMYNLDPDAEHNPLSTMAMAPVEIEEIFKVEVWRRVN